MAQFAVACGMHRITSHKLANIYQTVQGVRSSSPDDWVMIGRPQDDVELGERIYLWWSIFLLDKAGSITVGLPSALPNDSDPLSAPTTVWPRLLEDYARVCFWHVI